MSLQEFACSACGHRIGLLPGSSAIHGSCPNRQHGKPAPAYVRIEGDA